jgi:hypothetical protein
MSPTALLNSVDSAPRRAVRGSTRPAPEHLLDPGLIERLSALGQISSAARTRLWPPRTDWELHSFTFCAYCPQCCLDDLARDGVPYGRSCWQQSWCTICRKHSYPLVVRRDDGFLSRKTLLSDVSFLAANRYRNLTVPLNSKVRFDILSGVLEIQTAIDKALHKTPPSSWLWGDLTPDEFLLVVSDLTTWSLMHFECVSAWSAAEDFSPTEEQEGYGIIGRSRRMLPSDYADPHSTRTLRDFTTPRYAEPPYGLRTPLMARRHKDAPDRTTGRALQDRQEARIWRSPAAARDWLADRQQYWPPAYLEEFWIDTRSSVSLPGIGPDVTSIVGI